MAIKIFFQNSNIQYTENREADVREQKIQKQAAQVHCSNTTACVI